MCLSSTSESWLISHIETNFLGALHRSHEHSLITNLQQRRPWVWGCYLGSNERVCWLPGGGSSSHSVFSPCRCLLQLLSNTTNKSLPCWVVTLQVYFPWYSPGNRSPLEFVYPSNLETDGWTKAKLETPWPDAPSSATGAKSQPCFIELGVSAEVWVKLERAFCHYYLQSRQE